MKIAFLGKGGSGKSTISWLASEVSVASDTFTLTIDADHNMDICHIYNVSIDSGFPTLHRNHAIFREFVGHKEDSRWHQIVLDDRTLPEFTINPTDQFTAQVTRTLKNNHLIMVTGLGTEDILHSGKCAHGHSAPLKYYLPLLQLKPNERVIIDGVAGVDMLNFGLFTGADIQIGVVEPHPNSIRVAREILRLGTTTNTPTRLLINKARENEHYHSIKKEFSDCLIGEIPAEAALMDYNYSAVPETITKEMEKILTSLSDISQTSTGFERLKTFEANKQAAKV